MQVSEMLNLAAYMEIMQTRSRWNRIKSPLFFSAAGFSSAHMSI